MSKLGKLGGEGERERERGGGGEGEVSRISKISRKRKIEVR